MSEPARDGVKKIPAPMIKLADGSFLIRFDGDDPDALVDRTIRPANVIPRIQSEPVADICEELHAFQQGMQQLERDNPHRFLYWREVLEAIHALGYRKVANSTIEVEPPASTPPANS
jgi:hypothetical protein